MFKKFIHFILFCKAIFMDGWIYLIGIGVLLTGLILFYLFKKSLFLSNLGSIFIFIGALISLFIIPVLIYDFVLFFIHKVISPIQHYLKEKWKTTEEILKNKSKENSPPFWKKDRYKLIKQQSKNKKPT